MELSPRISQPKNSSIAVLHYVLHHQEFPHKLRKTKMLCFEDVFSVSVREVPQEVVHACVMKMGFVGARVV